ncbi:MAG: ferrous iron transport protein A [Lachnospiraceae bacterium]|nr:ferrous iron transport protein A [Lachnospiraceae bacterium]
MNLSEAKLGADVVVKEVIADDEELKGFLFSLGCYSGEVVTLVSKKRGGYVLSLKDARYNIDEDLAKAIIIN